MNQERRSTKINKSCTMCLMSLLMLTCMNGSGTSAFTLLPASITPSSTTSSSRTTRSIVNNINSLKEESQTTLFMSSTSQQQQQQKVKVQHLSQRRIASIQKYARIPVWPAWNGALLFLLSLLPDSIMPNSTIAKLEDLIGGRVCPNFFDSSSTSTSATNNPSPFLMLVHHSHSFTSIDPLRKFQSSVILPEGFPAHPHRGFITLTYCIKGGMIHRDSLGTKQSYGAQERHQGNVAQWLIAGAGMLHEEMWDVVHGKDNKGNKGDGLVSKQELFQLWVNLPAQHKMTNPRVTLLNTNDNDTTGTDDETGTDNAGNLDHETVAIPMVQTEQSKTLVLIGEYENARSDVETLSPMSILHVQIEPKGSWQVTLPDSFKTGILYMRTGSASCSSQEIDAHYTATLTPNGDTFQLTAGEDGADFMLLVGEPLYEPVQAQGSMVMNDPEEINVAYDDYQRGLMGRPWEHTLTDEEWELHSSKFPSVYK